MLDTITFILFPLSCSKTWRLKPTLPLNVPFHVSPFVGIMVLSYSIPSRNSEQALIPLLPLLSVHHLVLFNLLTTAGWYLAPPLCPGLSLQYLLSSSLQDLLHSFPCLWFYPIHLCNTIFLFVATKSNLTNLYVIKLFPISLPPKINLNQEQTNGPIKSPQSTLAFLPSSSHQNLYIFLYSSHTSLFLSK